MNRSIHLPGSFRGPLRVLQGALMLLILSVFVLVDPFSVGVATVLTVAGVGLIVLGIIFCTISFKLKNLHKMMEREYPSK